MAQFDESKIITALHPEKAEVGKKYWYSDSTVWLKRKVENNEPYSTLKNFKSPYFEVVESEDLLNKFFLLYPYEEPPKKRMTNIQLIEWLSKGNGVYKGLDDYAVSYHASVVSSLDEEVDKTYLIRPFGQTEWIEPTVDIYERDCKKKED